MASEHVLGAWKGVAQGTVGVVEDAAGAQGISAVLCRGASEPVRVEQAAALVEGFLQGYGVHRQMLMQAKEGKVIRLGDIQLPKDLWRQLRAGLDGGGHEDYAVKLVPQPQAFLALGFSNAKPDCIRLSL